MTKKDIHVVPHGGGWATRKEGAQRVGHTADTQRGAFELAREQPSANMLRWSSIAPTA